MKTFITVLKINYLRTRPRIILLVVMTAIALSSTMLAVYLSGVPHVKGRVVLITKDEKTVLGEQSKYLKFSVAQKEPPYSALVEQKYDAYVTFKTDGNYTIKTLKNQKYEEMLLYLLTHPKAKPPKIGYERGIGANIIGFMMMFLMMLSFSNLYVFADDKEQGQIKKVFAAPASFWGYLLAHVIYCLSLLFPEYILLVILKLSGRNIGFSLPEYAGLIVVIGFFGVSLAMLLYVMIQKSDNATMLGNSIMVLATTLSGSFYSFSKNNEILDHIIKVLPQKAIMDFIQYLEQGKGVAYCGYIIYVILFSAVLFAISCIKLQKMYIKRV